MADVTSDRWRWVPGAEGFYKVSEDGLAWSRPRRGTAGGLMRLRPNPRGYLMVTLVMQGIIWQRCIHQLVMEAFDGPCPEGMEIRHLDGDPANNARSNLKYGTHAENMQDMLRHGRNPRASRTHCIRGHEFTPENTRLAYKPDGSVKQRQCRACRREFKRLLPLQSRDCIYCGTSFTPRRKTIARLHCRACTPEAKKAAKAVDPEQESLLNT